jgi:hypothetical protein
MSLIVRKAEVLTMLGKAGSISQSDEALLDMLHPLCESAIATFLQQDLNWSQHVEYLPHGTADHYESTLDDPDFRTSEVVLVSGRPGSTTLQLKHLPVWRFGLEVREDIDADAGQSTGAFGSSSVLTIGTDYFLDIDDPAAASGQASQENGSHLGLSRTGMLHRRGAWPAEPRTVKVTYYGGWAASQLANRGSASAIKLAYLRTIVASFWSVKSSQTNSGAGLKASEIIGEYSYSLGGQGLASLSAGVHVPMDAMLLLQPFRNYGRAFG